MLDVLELIREHCAHCGFRGAASDQRCLAVYLGVRVRLNRRFQRIVGVVAGAGLTIQAGVVCIPSVKLGNVVDR